MTSLLFSRKKIEIIRRGQLGKPSPVLLTSHCLYILPAFTLVTQGRYPCWCLHLEPRFQLLSCLPVHCSSSFLLICYSKGQHTFPAKGQIVSISGFMGLMIFVTVFQLKLYKGGQKSNQAGHNSLSIPVLYHQYIPQLDWSLSPSIQWWCCNATHLNKCSSYYETCPHFSSDLKCNENLHSKKESAFLILFISLNLSPNLHIGFLPHFQLFPQEDVTSSGLFRPHLHFLIQI